MEKVRAKFECVLITDTPEHEQKEVHLDAVIDGSPENKSFSKYTPAGDLALTISYETPAVDFFEKGKEYYIDISPAN